AGVPLRVAGPLATATALAPDPVGTVRWYTGENGPLPARNTAVARVDQGQTVAYGARANEQAFTLQLQNIAVFATLTTSAANPDGPALIAALYQRVGNNTTVKPAQQSLEDVQVDFAGA